MKKTTLALLTGVGLELVQPIITANAQEPPASSTPQLQRKFASLDQFLESTDGKRWLGFDYSYIGEQPANVYSFKLSVNKFPESLETEEGTVYPHTPYDQFRKKAGQLIDLFDRFNVRDDAIQAETMEHVQKTTGVLFAPGDFHVARGSDGRVYEVFVTKRVYNQNLKDASPSEKKALKKHFARRKNAQGKIENKYHVMILKDETISLTKNDFELDLDTLLGKEPKERVIEKEVTKVVEKVPKGYIKKEDCPPAEIHKPGDVVPYPPGVFNLSGFLPFIGYSHGFLNNGNVEGKYHLLDLGLGYSFKNGFVLAATVGVPLEGDYDTENVHHKVTQANPNDPDSTGGLTDRLRDRSIKPWDIKLKLGGHAFLPWLIVYGTLGVQPTQNEDEITVQETLTLPDGTVVGSNQNRKKESSTNMYGTAGVGVAAFLSTVLGAYIEYQLRTNFEEVDHSITTGFTTKY